MKFRVYPKIQIGKTYYVKFGKNDFCEYKLSIANTSYEGLVRVNGLWGKWNNPNDTFWSCSPLNKVDSILLEKIQERGGFNLPSRVFVKEVNG